jgi:hypothetical protein
MNAAKPDSQSEAGNNGQPPAKDHSTLDGVFVRQGYSLLSTSKGGILKGGDLLLRPATARLTLSKLRISKPIIRRILIEMEREGLVTIGNQFIVVRKYR